MKKVVDMINFTWEKHGSWYILLSEDKSEFSLLGVEIIK